MKVISLQTAGGSRDSIRCREIAIGRMRHAFCRSTSRSLKATMYYSNLSLLQRRLITINNMLSEYDVEPVELIIDERLLRAGPWSSIAHGFYLEMGNVGECLPAFHGILGYLRGGKTLELALAKASLQAYRCEAVDYGDDLEEMLPFNGAQSFLENTWPGIWAEDLTEAIKRYKKPNFEVVFASVWAHYMGFTKGIEPALPWGFSSVDEVIIDRNTYSLTREQERVPTYFMNLIRSSGVSRSGKLQRAHMPWTLLTKPFTMHVLIYPDHIFDQIPFIGKGE